MKTRILAIVPYIGMKEIINDIAASNKNIELTIHLGTLQQGLAIVQSYDPDDFDVIIARGGTAKLIAANVNIPVAEISISAYDILRAIKLAENYTSNFAIVGLSTVTENAILLRNLLRYDIPILTLSKPDEDKTVIQKLRDQGYEMIVCDMRTSNTADEVGINYILITSSRESIEAAFQQAILLSHIYHHHRKQAKLFKEAIKGSKEVFFIYDNSETLLYSSLSRNEFTEIFFIIAEKYLKSFFSNPSFHLEERVHNLLFSGYCTHTSVDGEPYICIYLYKQDAPALIDELGISLYDTIDEKNGNSDFCGSANLIGDIRHTLTKYAQNLQPVLLLGEIGTGKDKAATFLCNHSEYKNRPFFSIDCQNTNQKKWNYFIESPNSPLNNLHTTIYIKNMQALHESISEKFLSYLKKNDLCKRNRFIFSYTISSENEVSTPVCQYLMNTLFCMLLRLPSLRERISDIPSIVTLYISQANIELGKQVIGFEPAALNMIQDFDWKQNLPQLKRVIRQLIVLTDNDYISADLVKQTLKQENPCSPLQFKPGYGIVNLNQSLNDINYDIVRMVLEQENMNKTKTVEHLKISRTTLWRMLQH